MECLLDPSHSLQSLIELNKTTFTVEDTVAEASDDSSISESSLVPKDVNNPFGPEIGEIRAVSPCDLCNKQGFLWIATRGLIFRRSFLGIGIDRKVISWDSVTSILEGNEVVEIRTSNDEIFQLKDFQCNVNDMAKLVRIASNRNSTAGGSSTLENEEGADHKWSSIKPLDIVVTVSSQCYSCLQPSFHSNA